MFLKHPRLLLKILAGKFTRCGPLHSWSKHALPEMDEGYVLANLIATAFGNPEIKLTLKGDDASEEALKKYADQIMEALENALARKK